MHGDFSPRFVSARTAVHKLTVREKILSLPAMPTPSRNYKSRICKRSKTCNGFTMTWRFWHMNGVAKFGGRICFQVSSMNASCSLHSDHCLNVSKMHCWHCSNWHKENVNWHGVTWSRLLKFFNTATQRVHVKTHSPSCASSTNGSTECRSVPLKLPHTYLQLLCDRTTWFWNSVSPWGVTSCI